jgi:hypothetical protein
VFVLTRMFVVGLVCVCCAAYARAMRTMNALTRWRIRVTPMVGGAMRWTPATTMICVRTSIATAILIDARFDFVYASLVLVYLRFVFQLLIEDGNACVLGEDYSCRHEHCLSDGDGVVLVVCFV